ncbi:PorT family protein [Chryseobacterium nepalense]|uniref:PorT family protein n=1 Tax=Chryseobacterium nepalense TaxID=1854498 RepID=A0ABY4K3P2_9FLAO|nr:PorT family protein [Chryseobacterium nepalense]UPQ75408.1 PorT family protein [Chryseobacterium nepalense]
MNVRPGINFYSPLKTEGILGAGEFASRTNFRLGLEAEIILPFNKNKWAILLEPTYSLYSNENLSISSDNNLYTISIKPYSFINIPVGIRYYLFLNDQSKLFVNASVNVLNIRMGQAKSVDLSYNNQTFDRADLASTLASKSFSFGLGYVYKNKFSIEARYNSQYNIIANSSPTREVNLSYTSLILGYNIF